MNNDKRTIIHICRAAKTLLLSGLMAMTCACNDFLTIYPTDRVVLEDFWKSKTDVESMVAESYRLMTQNDFMSRLIVWGEVRGDNVIEGNNVSTDVRNVLEADILPSNGYATWSIFYQVINNCNVVLHYAPGVLDEDPDFTQGDLDVVCGQMYAIRALCHFYLVRAFRDIPLLSEAMIGDNQNLYQKQVEPLVALDSCLNDLRRAEKLVLTSGNYQDNASNKGRITKDAVRAMIADVYLWKAAFKTYNAKGDATVAKSDYDSCVFYCDKVLDARMAYVNAKQEENKFVFSNSGLALNDSLPILFPSEDSYDNNTVKRFPHQPYFDVFAGGCNSMCESIFEIQHATNQETGNYEVPNFYGKSNDNGNSFSVGWLSASRCLALLDGGGVYNRTDFRRVGNVFSQGESVDKFGIIKYGYGSATEAASGAENDYGFATITYKFWDNGGNSYFSNNQVNWIVYRITDVILMKAEALALSETDLNTAFNLVHTIYNRSQSYFDEDGDGIADYGKADSQDYFKNKYKGAVGNAQQIAALVLEERQRELAFEGKRWFDLVRMALRSKDGTSKEMLDLMIDKKYESNQKQYRSKMASINSLFFPISEREINTNPLLKQNEAYNKTESVEQN